MVEQRHDNDGRRDAGDQGADTGAGGPMPKPKISTALTVMLITFTTREQNMDTLLLPMARNRRPRRCKCP